MSRKDYNRIAAVINSLQSEFDVAMAHIRSTRMRKDKATAYLHSIVANKMTNALKGTNPRYDSARFYRACTKAS